MSEKIESKKSQDRALQFGSGQDLLRAFHLLDKISNNGSPEYYVLGDRSLLMSPWTHNQLRPLLEKAKPPIGYIELEVVSIGDLPSSEQSALRRSRLRPLSTKSLD